MNVCRLRPFDPELTHYSSEKQATRELCSRVVLVGVTGLEPVTSRM